METPERESVIDEIVEEDRVADEPLVPTDDVEVPLSEDEAPE